MISLHMLALLIRQCEQFKIISITDLQFQYLIYAYDLRSPSDIDIRTHILGKIEQNLPL